jgi:chromosome segregation ATPase
MMQKIKELMKIKELIDEINGKINSNNEIINNLKSEINLLSNNLNEIKNAQKEFLTGFKENLNVVKDLRKDFEEEIHEFRLLKGQIQNKILENFEKELQKELRFQIENLKKDYTDYEELKKKMDNVVNKMDNLGGEIDKFVNISNKIKERDFEMEKFAKQLLEMDKEKLNLMRKIDTLERLIARMRRHNK